MSSCKDVLGLKDPTSKIQCLEPYSDHYVCQHVFAAQYLRYLELLSVWFD